MDILKDNWGPAIGVADIIRRIQMLMSEPSANHALNTEAAEVLSKQPEAFNKEAKEWTQKFAMGNES